MGVKKRVRHRARVLRAQKNEAAMLKADCKTQSDEVKITDPKNLVIAKEIRIARLLANMDKKIRDKALKRLKKWLTLRSQSSFEFTYTDFMCLWKGLFYCMWLSDTLLIQEEVAESISKLVHCFNSMDTIILYTSCAFTTLSTEWVGLGFYHKNKFTMLARRILRQTFVICREKSWDMKWIMKISQVFEQLFLNPKSNLGLNLHMTDIYLEELAKIGDGDLPEDAVHEFIKPFAVYLASSWDERPMKQIMRHVFRHLIFQSNVGMDYTDKFEVWRNAGFPCARIDDMERVDASEESDENVDDDNDNEELSMKKKDMQSKSLDPRAGRVDVVLSPLPFDPEKIAQILEQYKFHPTSTAKSRRQVLRLIKEFRELAEGRMPLGVKRVRKPNTENISDMKPKKGALRLIQFEKDMFVEKLSKNRKEKKNRKLIELDASDEPSLDNSEKEDTSDIDMNAVDSENDSIDTAATTQTNVQNSNVNVPHLDKSSNKRKGKKNRKLDEFVVSDQPSLDNSENEDTSDVDMYVDAVDSESDSIDTAASTTKTGVQNSNADVPFKKRKRTISTHESASKRKVVAKNTEEEPEIKIATKRNKIKKIKSKHKSDTHVADKSHAKRESAKMKAISRKQASGSEDQCVSLAASVSQNQKRMKKMKTKSVAKINASRDGHVTPLKTKLSNKVKEQLDKSSSAKKKVVFGLYRNTAQHTSEYLQQIRNSPGIPFDANKKPSAGVLKMSPLPSPINPFYKRKLAAQSQRI